MTGISYKPMLPRKCDRRALLPKKSQRIARSHEFYHIITVTPVCTNILSNHNDD
jgi:hypothetical protein